MLRYLRVTNFAILSDVTIEPGEHMNALTGETGAGKSLIVDAVNLIRGGRASADIPRTGADEATVEAIFSLPNFLRAKVSQLLLSAGLPDEEELVIRRIIQRGGRSRAYVNGALTTASSLATIGRYLVDLSGQHQHQGLVDSSQHREILDAFADMPELVAAMRETHEEVVQIEARKRDLAGDSGEFAEKLDFLRFQLSELVKAKPEIDEDVQLKRERDVLAGNEALATGTAAIDELLYSGDGSAVERLDLAASKLSDLARTDERLAAHATQLEEARAIVEDVARFVERYANNLEGDPERLDEIEERLTLLQRLKRKHGPELSDVVDRMHNIESEVQALENRDAELEKLDKKLAEAIKARAKVAARLTRARKKCASILVEKVQDALAELSMGGATFSIQVAPRSGDTIHADGGDHVEFLLSANPGERAKPLAKIASGGELSRIMLALKLILRSADQVSCYVFDEVDTGIGGEIAEVVGRKIHSIGKDRQILCITHLPQIAAFAESHFRISKAVVEGRTETSVDILSRRERPVEIARMIGGKTMSANARAHAKEMLAAAR